MKTNWERKLFYLLTHALMGDPFMDGVIIQEQAHGMRQSVNYMADLGLQMQAEKYFTFLVSENGYMLTISSPWRVRFESPTTFIELRFDANRSYQLDLLLGTKAQEDSGMPAFSISEILRLRQAPNVENLSLVQVTKSEVMAFFIERFAQALQVYAEDFIAGNKSSFDEVARQRQKDTQSYALKRKLQDVREKVEVAWHAKDYETVVKTLKPLRAALTAIEIGKLEFAEKQIRQAE